MTAQPPIGEPDYSEGDYNGASMKPEVQSHIGRQLRAVYEEVVNEAVPDRFIRLLAELESKKAKGS